MKKLIGFVIFVLFSTSFLFGQCFKERQLSKANATNPRVRKFNINNISTYIYNDARSDNNSGRSGFEYPRGSGKHMVYASGFMWGGKFNDEVRFGGAMYGSGLNPGKIISPGIWQNPEEARIYRVRKNFQESDLLNEQNDELRPYSELYNEYLDDWNNWPADDGAPYQDNDGDGIYNPSIDTPGIWGSEQTIWYTANSADSEKTRWFFRSPPMDIELQVTTWGLDEPGFLSNVIFRKYLMINKGTIDAKDMYLTYWSDADIGNASSDYVGCDTTLGLGFAYEASDNDRHYGANGPAVGYTYLQGPLVDGNPEDVGNSFGQAFQGMKNLDLTAFWYFTCSDGIFASPDMDNYTTGSLYYYQILQGRIPSTGELYTIPEEFGGWKTPFMFPGDPVSQTGWYNTEKQGCGDKNILTSTGPFNLAVGDTQEIILAQIVAGGVPGVGNLEALSLLKEYTKALHDYYDNGFSFPKPQRVSEIIYASSSNSINLRWSNEPEINENGDYKFQGYNIYQVPTPGAPISDGIKITTFDVIDGVKVIVQDQILDGQEYSVIVQQGNDTGIQHEFEVTKDYLSGNELCLGKEYYFALSNYNYNHSSTFGFSYESEPTYITVTMGENDEHDIEKINVFPNPYYGANPNELNKYQRYVTFSHLPEQATIKIFNLAGHLVKTIYKSEPGQFQRWDLMNEFNTFVPGGIYIAYIEMPKLGETKNPETGYYSREDYPRLVLRSRNEFGMTIIVYPMLDEWSYRTPIRYLKR